MLASDISIRPISSQDALAWEQMRYALWPGADESHSEVIKAFFHGGLVEPAEVLVAFSNRDLPVAFVELSIRTDLPGLLGNRTGYIEGLYVEPAWRLRGIVRRLLCASRLWARAQACTHFASDRDNRLIMDVAFTR